MLDAITARLERVLGGERVRRLHRASVAVIGAGLLGGQLLQHLAMLQIKTLIVDPGVVDPENLGNQLLPASTLGEPKVVARSGQMKALNGTCPVRILDARVEDVGLGAFEGIDLLLTGLDGPASRLAVNRIAARLGIDWIDSAVDGSGERTFGTVTWLRPHRDDLGCYGCRFRPADLASAAREVRREPCASWRNPSLPDTPPTLMASTFGAVVAGHQMSWGIQALLGESQELVGQQLQISGGPGLPRMRGIELARRRGCVFPHAKLHDLQRVECESVGGLVERAAQDLGAAPDALVFPERSLVFGLACSRCGNRKDVAQRCETVDDDAVRCHRCDTPDEMAPIEFGSRLGPDRLAALGSRAWTELGLPAEDLVTAELGPRRAHYLLPRRAQKEMA